LDEREGTAFGRGRERAVEHWPDDAVGKVDVQLGGGVRVSGRTSSAVPAHVIETTPRNVR
jgi:FKBP-type peptidyl-prolyl cis-trans isomerase 2